MAASQQPSLVFGPGVARAQLVLLELIPQLHSAMAVGER